MVMKLRCSSTYCSQTDSQIEVVNRSFLNLFSGLGVKYAILVLNSGCVEFA